jgi:hypothetical protein
MSEVLMNMSKYAGLLALGVVFGSVSPALAAEPEEDHPILEEGLQFRLEVGWADTWVRRKRASDALEQKFNGDAASLALRVGYVPSDWLALHLFLQDTTARSSYETNGSKAELRAENTMVGIDAQLYPMSNSGLFLGLGGGVAFVGLDDAAEDSMMIGPGFSASFGGDHRAFADESGDGYLLGVALRLDMAPSVKGDGYEGSAYALSFAFTATL